MPQTEIVPALLFFNVGVEAEQLAFIGVLLALVFVLKRITQFDTALQRFEYLGGYALGLPAAFRFFQRLQAF